MRLEVLVDSEDPKIFPLNKDKISIGSSESCDIILPADSISRKHLVVICEGESFFVVDQGSSNGSYLNEERLVPGRRVEFTSFFPVRLGSNVLITLLSDSGDEANEASTLIPFPEKKEIKSTSDKEQATKVISLKDLQNTKTQNLVQKRQAQLTKKNTPEKKVSHLKKDTRRTQMVQVVVVIVLGVAIYYNFFHNNNPEAIPTTAVVENIVKTPIEKKEAEPTTPVAKPAGHLVEVTDLTPVENFPSLLSDIKCTTQIESSLCMLLGIETHQRWGVVQVGTMIHIVYDALSIHDEAKSYFPARNFIEGAINGEEKKKFEAEFKQLIGAIFIAQKFPTGVDFKQLENNNITIWLYDSAAEKLLSTLAIKPYPLQKLKESFTMSHLSKVREVGMSSVSYLEKYYLAY